MSRNFVISTDTNCDLPLPYAKERGLLLLPLDFILEGVTYHGDEEKITMGEFYDKMRAGATPTTTQVNFETARERFEPLLKEGKDILHLSFSSALSGSYNTVNMVAQELQEHYPERTIIVLDSLCASLGQGLLVHKALNLRDEGKSLEEIARWVQDNKLHICHNFTVEDLKYLYRGGRVSRTTAVVGTALGIKPIMHVDNEGRLVPCGKVRGRKASLNALVDNMVKQCQGMENDIFFISHGDCMEEAEYVAKLVREKLKIEKCLINHVGASVGSHSGPGTMALFFMGNVR